MTNRILITGLSSIFMLLVTGLTQDPYSSKDGNFQAAFPVAPKTAKQNLPGPGGVRITAYSTTAKDKNGTMYSVNYAEYPSANETMLDQAVDGMIKSAKMQPSSRENMMLDGHPGREVKFTVNPPRGVKVKGVGQARCFLIGNKIYQVLVIGPESKLTAGAMTGFVESFALLNPVAVDAGAAPAPAPAVAVGPMVDRTEPGIMIDPDRDCKITPARSGATIFVPAKAHDLSPTFKMFNAPRLMRDVVGDFVVEVRALHIEPEGQGVREGVAYRGAGLVFWQDKDHYVRFERASIMRDGQRYGFLFYAKTENGQEIFQGGNPLPEVGVTFKLERKGDKLLASFNDGRNWQDLKPMDITGWPATGQIGVEAINATAKPLTAQFEAYKLRAADVANGAKR